MKQDGDGEFEPSLLDLEASASVLFQKVQTFGNVMFVLATLNYMNLKLK